MTTKTKNPLHPYIPAPPRPLELYDSLRSVGYSLAASIADLIDNSIAHKATSIEVQAIWRELKSYILIIDNGDGIPPSRLIQAMTMGDGRDAARKVNDLGRFGFGLKTASMAQCTCFTVITKTRDDTSPRIMTSDRKVIEETGNWNLYSQLPTDCELPSDALRIEESGTIIVWQDLDRIVRIFGTGDEAKNAFYDQFREVKSHLSRTFHRFLERNEITISVTGNKLTPSDPLLLAHKLTQRQPIRILSDKSTKLSAVIIPHPRHFESDPAHCPKMSDQGFYVYRKDRLICAAKSLLRQAKSPEHRLLRVSIELNGSTDDAWKIDFRKTSVTVPIELRADIRKYLVPVLINAEKVLRSRNSQVVRRISADQTPIEYAWDVHSSSTDVSRRLKINGDHSLLLALKQLIPTDEGRSLLDAFLDFLTDTIPYEQLFVIRPGIDEHESAADVRKRAVKISRAWHSTGKPFEELKNELMKMEMFTDHRNLIAEITEDELK